MGVAMGVGHVMKASQCQCSKMNESRDIDTTRWSFVAAAKPVKRARQASSFRGIRHCCFRQNVEVK